jgi:hypothetical protein
MRAPQVGYPIFSTHWAPRHDIIATMEMSDAIAVLDALARESRLQIFRYLIHGDSSPASAGRLEIHAT